VERALGLLATLGALGAVQRTERDLLRRRERLVRKLDSER
jgi:hypothetical protein